MASPIAIQRTRQRVLLSASFALLLQACITVESSHWNLQELHNPDGSARRVAELRNGIQQAITEFISDVEFKVPLIEEVSGEGVVEDPLGSCLRNLNGLLDEPGENILWRARQVSMVTWLSNACGYSLSRERCALALPELGSHYGLTEPQDLDTERAFASPDEVTAMAHELAHSTGLKTALEPASGQPVMTLREVVKNIEALNMNRQGARRMLLTAAALLQRLPDELPDRSALVELEQRLGKKCLALCLHRGLNDENARVRSAALAAWIELSEGQDPRPYVLALGSGQVKNIQVAVTGMKRHGVPGIPEGSEASASSDMQPAAENYWAGVMSELLDTLREGPGALALCHGMAFLSGDPENLRPEHWIAWQLDQEARLQSAPRP